MRYTCTFLSLAILLPIGSIRADEGATKPVTVPFEMLATNHMAIKIKINGKGPYRVIFDTGAPVNILNSKVGKEAGIVAKNTSLSLFGMMAGSPQTTIPSLELGDVKLKNVSVIVMDHPTVTIMSKYMGPIEGIVGFPFFARFKMTLDYKAKELTFLPNGYKPSDTLEAMMNSLMVREGPSKKILAPSGLWGMTIDKPTGEEEAGVIIEQVYANSAAQKAGLKKGDRLLTLDDRWTDSVRDFYEAATLLEAGKAIKLVIRRDGKDSTKQLEPAPGL